MTDVDFSVSKITDLQSTSDNGIFSGSIGIDWLSWAVFGINVIILIVFLVYFFTHRYHYFIQRELNKIRPK